MIQEDSRDVSARSGSHSDDRLGIGRCGCSPERSICPAIASGANDSTTGKCGEQQRQSGLSWSESAEFSVDIFAVFLPDLSGVPERLRVRGAEWLRGISDTIGATPSNFLVVIGNVVYSCAALEFCSDLRRPSYHVHLEFVDSSRYRRCFHHGNMYIYTVLYHHIPWTRAQQESGKKIN